MSPFDRMHMTSYQRFTATTGISRTISEIFGDFSRKSQNFPTPLYRASPLNGFPWNWVLALGTEIRMMELPGRGRSLTIFLAVWIQSTNVTDRRHLATAKTALIRMASRGKKPTQLADWATVNLTYFTPASLVCMQH